MKFVEEHKAQVKEGPANIVEVKATVSSPDRKMDHSLNKAVNSELDRAIPLVLNRMQGPMGNLDDDDLRKELEQALVDELAKNLGETIDQMGTSSIDDDDLGKLIEREFSVMKQYFQTQPPMHREPSSRKTSPPRTTTSTRPTTTSVHITPEATTEWWMTTTHPTTTKTTTRRTTTAARTWTTPSSTTTSTSATTHPTKTTRPTTTKPWWMSTTPHTATTTRPTTTEPWWMSTTPHAATTSRPTTVKPEAMTTPWWMSTSPPTTSTTRPVTTTSRPTTTPPWWMVTTSSEVTTSRPTTTTRTAPWWMSTSPSTTRTTRPSSTTQWWMTTTPPVDVVTRPTAAATETWTTPWWMASPSTTVSTTQPTTRTRPTTTTPRSSPTTSRATTAEARPTTTTARPTTTTPTPMTTTSQPSTTVTTEATRPRATTSRATTASIRPTQTTSATISLVPESSATTLPPWRPTTTTTRSVVFFTTTSAPGRWRTTEVTFRTVPLHEQVRRRTFVLGNITIAPTRTFYESFQPCPTVNDPSDTNRTDVLFLLDSSNAFNQQKFMHAIKLIIETVSQFRNIGPNGTQVSLVQFNTEPYLEFSLRKHNCKQWLIDDIADTDYMQGGSMLGKAVEKVSRFAFTKNRGDRPDAENVLVILTDGQSDDRIQEPVAKKHNLTVLVIATLEANPYWPFLKSQRLVVCYSFGADSSNRFFAILDFNGRSAPGSIAVFTTWVQGKQKDVKRQNKVRNQQIVPTVLQISLNVPPGYEGVAVVKGQEDKEECTKPIWCDSSSDSIERADFQVQPPGTNYTLILHLKHSVPLVTGGDRAYLLQCYIGKPSEDQELTADLGVMKGELMIAETISLLSVPPTCVYSIRKDSADGPIVKNAYVGQTVYHRWECDGGEEANNVYGIQIHDCFASDDVDKNFQRHTKFPDSLTAYAESKAFAFTEADQLKFVCKLSLCTRDGDGCEGVTPPVCGGNSPEQLVTRRIRHQNSAMEGALSSALSTRVGVATSIPSTLKGRLTNLLSSGGSWIVLALLAIIATVGTVVLSRFALSSPYATTTCSDPETMTSPPTSPFPSLFSSPPMSPTPRESGQFLMSFLIL
ncbi:unnamed protein product [Haemonchus placei]|uniref:VWFA domain-containing protein n=2 Tax=Trichostrongylidae TaxID=6315 RepID=A0A3P7Y350_HAEPC|nr:unnamed protein product [Haemonchus placei]